MRHVWNVFKYELQRNLARKGYLFTTFALPVVLFIAYFGINALSESANDDDTEDSQTEALELFNQGIFIDYASGYVDLSGEFADVGDLPAWQLTAYPDEASAQTAIDNEEIEVYYIIAEDFAETQDVRLVLPTFSLDDFSEEPMRQLLLTSLSESVATDILIRLQFPIFMEEIKLESEADNAGVVVDAEAEQDENDDNFILVYGFAMIFMVSIFSTNGYLMQTVITEKETRVVEILISSVKPIQLLMGKILAMGCLGLFQIGVWIGTILILTQISGGSTVNSEALADIMDNIGDQLSAEIVLTILIYFVLGYLFFAAVFAAIGAISESMTNGPNIAAIFIMPAVALPMILLTQFIETPNGSLPQLLSMIPLTSPISMVMRVTSGEVPFGEIAVSMVLLIIFDVFVIWLAGRFFRAQSLLAGQTPKLRDIPAILRG